MIPITNINYNVKLKPCQYKEATLVSQICTPTEQDYYQQKGKFANQKARSAFLKRLSRYCEYEIVEGTNKIRVKRVFDIPISDNDVKYHEGIYKDLVPALLESIIDSCEKTNSLFTVKDFMRVTNLVNENYHFMDAHKEAIEPDLGIPYIISFEFFHKINENASDKIRNSLMYLRNQGCVDFEEIFIVENIKFEHEISESGRDVQPFDVSEDTRHIASDEEKELYFKIQKEAKKYAGITRSSELWVGAKSKVYYQELQNLLDENNIKFIIKGFRLWLIDFDCCLKMLQSYNSLDTRKHEIGAKFKESSDKNAAKRAENKSNANYLPFFKRLSEITLIYAAPDIRPNMPSAFKRGRREKVHMYQSRKRKRS